MPELDTADDRTRLLLEREDIANRPKHWVRLVTACNNRCLFCLDMDTPRNVYLPREEVEAELRRGREEKGAWKVILSGGEASVHPLFHHFIAYARTVGYGRVQTVTNGMNYADPAFLKDALDAGLGEMTFSLHGHNAELHDRLVQCPGAFDRLIKGMIMALRDGRPIVNIDIVINKQNVGVVDRIVALGARLGVREYDLLHVIPQAAAYRNRDTMFYDVREHLPRLQKVFRLNGRGFTIWTNRFPVEYLEGLEDLIQDPHKMLDEVNGRRHQVRRYLDWGTPLDCRDAERCPHCFIEPFCTTTDRVLKDMNESRFDVYFAGDASSPPEVLPFGAHAWGIDLPDLAALAEVDGRVPAGWGLYVRLVDATGFDPRSLPSRPLVLVLSTHAACEHVLQHPLPPGVEVEVLLVRDTEPWLLAHREVLEQDGLRLVQPTWERTADAVAHDVRDPAAFFRRLRSRVRVVGLPACACPGALLDPGLAVLHGEVFETDTGRLDIDELARHHVMRGYRTKSVRCADCAVTERCEGLHIHMIRDQGLQLARPLQGPAAEPAAAQLEALFPEPPNRVRHGAPPERAPRSLPGFPEPAEAPEDPLARKRGLSRWQALQQNLEPEVGARGPRPADR